MAKRKPPARSRRSGRQAVTARPRAKKRVRRASSGRPAGAARRKTAAPTKAPARAKTTVGLAKLRGAKAARQQTRTAKAARPARSTRSAGSKPVKSAAVPKTIRPSAKLTKTAKTSRPVKAALTGRPAAVKPNAPGKAVRVAPARPKSTLTAVPPLEQSRRRRAPDLNRERRRVQDDDAVVSPTPPSSLGLDRTASAARSGRQELRERYDNHHETGPVLTAGDIDADWESAYSTGDEAPGGDNPTPDQNVVDDIGLAVGVAYDDNEELEGADRIEERDRHRWEFDPASSDDFDER